MTIRELILELEAIAFKEGADLPVYHLASEDEIYGRIYEAPEPFIDATLEGWSNERLPRGLVL